MSSHDLPLAIAGIQIDLRSPLGAGELGIEDRLGSFFGPLADPIARVALWWEEGDAPEPPGELIYDPGSIWRMYRSGPDFHAVLTYHDAVLAEQARCVLRTDAGWDDVTIVERRSAAPFRSLLGGGAGELLLRTTIVRTGGLVLHASGVDDHGRGIVFPGRAGAGKSRLLSLWQGVPGAVAMNDDRIAVRVGPSGAECHGTPWGGTEDIARNHAAPLAALVLLEPEPALQLERLAPGAAMQRLIPRAFLPFWDPALLERALANLEALVAQVPAYVLRGAPCAEAIALARSVL